MRRPRNFQTDRCRHLVSRVAHRAMLNRLFDGFKGNLTSSKWAKICKVSQDTASREINALVAKGILRREGQGRSTHYALFEECCQCGNVADSNDQFQ